jgi:hypothetical protein
MKRTLLLLAVSTAVMILGLLAAFASAGNSAPKVQKDADHVTICHATGSASNPFVQISPSASGVFNGHLGQSHQDGRDIIPPFEYKGQTYSQNWDATGQAIFKNGCKPVGTTTTTPTTTTSTTTPTTTSTTTTTTPTKTVTTPPTTVTSPTQTVTSPTVTSPTVTVTQTVTVKSKPVVKKVVKKVVVVKTVVVKPKLPTPPKKATVKPSVFPYTP